MSINRNRHEENSFVKQIPNEKILFHWKCQSTVTDNLLIRVKIDVICFFFVNQDTFFILNTLVVRKYKLTEIIVQYQFIAPKSNHLITLYVERKCNVSLNYTYRKAFQIHHPFWLNGKVVFFNKFINPALH